MVKQTRGKALWLIQLTSSVRGLMTTKASLEDQEQALLVSILFLVCKNLVMIGVKETVHSTTHRIRQASIFSILQKVRIASCPRSSAQDQCIRSGRHHQDIIYRCFQIGKVSFPINYRCLLMLEVCCEMFLRDNPKTCFLKM